MEESASDGLIEGTELQNLSQIMRGILKDESSSGLLLAFLPVDTLLNGIIEFNDVGMAEFLENGGLLVEDVAEELLRISMVLGGELDGKVASVVGCEFDPEWMDAYLPKVPSPRVSMMLYLS